jgi:hypothetical protein
MKEKRYINTAIQATLIITAKVKRRMRKTNET